MVRATDCRTAGPRFKSRFALSSKIENLAPKVAKTTSECDDRRCHREANGPGATAGSTRTHHNKMEVHVATACIAQTAITKH